MSQTLSFVGHDGLDLKAASSGPAEGTPVLLVHGGGQTRRAWRRAAEVIAAEGFHAIALDLRGHGESAWCGKGDYALSHFAKDIIAVTAQIGGRLHYVGASLGGLSGLIAEGDLNPGGFASLTLVDITPNMSPDGVARIMGFMAQHMEEGFASPEHAADVIAAYTPNREKRGPSDSLKHYLRLGVDGRYRWHWDPAFITGMDADTSRATDYLESSARALRLPVHLVRGQSSDLVSPEAAQDFLKLVPHARYDDIAGTGHMVVGDRNDVFCDVILCFLKELAPTA